MLFETYREASSGCLSYLVGCPSAGVAAVVDPFLPAESYLAEAKRHGLAITHVLDTHIHADHRSTGAALARAAGGAYLLHEAAPFASRFEPLAHRDRLTLGRVVLEAVHTPGHTPESMCLAVADRKRSDDAWVLLTGDTLFVGDVGRPDLGVQERREAAAELYDSVVRRLAPFGDEVEVFPAHYAGSVCGRYLSPKASSTLGFERRHNLGLRLASEEAFVEHACQELLQVPPGLEDILAHNRGQPDAGPGRAVAPEA